MSSRFSRFAAVVSVLCGVLVFSLFKFFPSPELKVPAGGEDFAVLSVDESRDDRSVREILGRGGITGLISESSQEVAVDDFGTLKMIALDSFRNEIEPFDPRDDGYAAKLRDFFVRDGKRFFFIPLKDVPWNGIKLQKQLGSLLGDIPFTLTVLEQKEPIFMYFLLLAAACVFALHLSRAPRFFLFEFPVLLAFSRGGSFGFVLAALLCGIWELLREPLGELLAARRNNHGAFGGAPDYAGTAFAGLRERLRPFRMNFLLLLFLALFFAVFSVAGALSPIPLAAACLCFFLLYFLAFRVEAERNRRSGHIPFTPAPLLPFRTRYFSLFPLLLPFVAASVLALFLPLVFPDFSHAREKDPVADILAEPQYLLSSEDYYRHIAFQKSFSYVKPDQDLYLKDTRTPEAGGGALNQEGYLRYYLGSDGLIGGGTAYAPGGPLALTEESGEGELAQSGVPSFPLEKLMGFLIDYSKPAVAGNIKADTVNRKFAVSGIFLNESKEWISVAIIFAASLLNHPRLNYPRLNFFRPEQRSRKKKKVPVFRDKRIAA